jgi:hypothetical protein
MVCAQCAGVVVSEDVPLSWLRSSDSGWDSACRGVAVCGVRVGGGAQALARCLLVGTGSPGPGPAAVALTSGQKSPFSSTTLPRNVLRTARLPHLVLSARRMRDLGGALIQNGYELERVRRRARALRTQQLRQARGVRAELLFAAQQSGRAGTPPQRPITTQVDRGVAEAFIPEPLRSPESTRPVAGKVCLRARTRRGVPQTGLLEVQVATGTAASAARGFGPRGVLRPFGQPCSDTTVCGSPITFRCDRRRTRVAGVRRTVSGCSRGFLPIM